jgi:cell division protein YceG involved in septum cleavage
MKALFRIFAVAALLAVIGGGWAFMQLNRRYEGFSQPVFLEFERGTSTQAMARQLADKGVVESPWLFLAARAVRRGTNLQAGESKFDKRADRARGYLLYGTPHSGGIQYVRYLGGGGKARNHVSRELPGGVERSGDDPGP